MVAAATAFVAAPASAAPKADKPVKGSGNSKAVDNRNNNTSEKLRRAVSAEDLLVHQRVLQGIADRNGDTYRHSDTLAHTYWQLHRGPCAHQVWDDAGSSCQCSRLRHTSER